jgi:tetratricopeptide (TPR) repeat protein
MARSAQRKRQSSPRSRQQPEGARPKKRSNQLNSYEQEMFFPRLRRQAKWMFVFLAVVFGFGYVIFNVGGSIPGTGLGDVLQGLGQGGGTANVGDARNDVADHPNDPQAYLKLADALTQNNKTDESIPALEGYLRLKPNDPDQISRLAGLYMGRGSRFQQDALNAQAEVAAATPGAAFAPSTGLLTQLRAQGEVEKALSSEANQKLSQASSDAASAFQSATTLWQRLGRLQPNDSAVQFSLAQSAEQAGDYASAIKAYQQFIKLAPDDPNVPAIKRQIALLKAQQQIQPTAQPSG